MSSLTAYISKLSCSQFSFIRTSHNRCISSVSRHLPYIPRKKYHQVLCWWAEKYKKVERVRKERKVTKMDHVLASKNRNVVFVFIRKCVSMEKMVSRKESCQGGKEMCPISSYVSSCSPWGIRVEIGLIQGFFYDFGKGLEVS